VREDLQVGKTFPDLRLPDHAGTERQLGDLTAGHPTVVHFYRGWWCPKEQQFMRNLVALQDEMEVAYTRIVSITVDPPEITAPFRAGLGARWTFLSDTDRSVQRDLDIEETADKIHRPHLPYSFVVEPELTIAAIYNGYWYWGRPTNEELRRDLRDILRRTESTWDPQASRS
jgi:peroxiredoxin